MHRFIDADAVLVRLFETHLKGAEETAPSRNGEDHTAKFAQGFVPFFDGHSVAFEEGSSYFEEAQSPMFWEFDGLGDSVNNPPEEDFSRGPLGVSLCQLAQ